MFGLLNIHKPTSVSSRFVVDQIAELIAPEKVGHAGTLDPLATGVLVMCVGHATRLTEYIQQQSKRYRATFLFGRQSDTEDTSGTVTEMPHLPQPSLAEVLKVLPKFIGEIQQVPPAFSAIKLNGKRAYRLARRGKKVTLESRPISIYGLELVSYSFPELTLDVHCGSGTYVRSLGRDVARALGTEAAMCALMRTAIGDFRIENAWHPEQVSRESLPTQLLPAVQALPQLPQITLSETDAAGVLCGKTIFHADGTLAGEIAAFDPEQKLVAIMQPREPHWLRPLRTFPRG